MLRLTILLAGCLRTTASWNGRFGEGDLSNRASATGPSLYSAAGGTPGWVSASVPWEVMQVMSLGLLPTTVSAAGPNSSLLILGCCGDAGLPVLVSVDTRQATLAAVQWYATVNVSAFSKSTFDAYDPMAMDILLASMPRPLGNAEDGHGPQATAQLAAPDHVVLTALGGFGQVPLFACITAHNITANGTALWSHCDFMPWSLDGYPLVRLVQLTDSVVGFFYSTTTRLAVRAYKITTGELMFNHSLVMLTEPWPWSDTNYYAAFAVSVPGITGDDQVARDGVAIAVSFTGTPTVSRWQLYFNNNSAVKVWAQDPTAGHPRCNMTACWHPSPDGNDWMLGLNSGINTPMWSNEHDTLVHYCGQSQAQWYSEPLPGCMTGISASTGQLLWQHYAPGIPPYSLSMHNDTAVVVTGGVGWNVWPPTGPSLMMGVDLVSGKIKYSQSAGEEGIFGWSTMDIRGHLYVEAQYMTTTAVLEYDAANGQVMSSTADRREGSECLFGAPFHVGDNGALLSAAGPYGTVMAMYPLPSPGPTASPRPYTSFSPTPSAAAPAPAGPAGPAGSAAVIGGAAAAGVVGLGALLGAAWRFKRRQRQRAGSGLAALGDVTLYEQLED